MNIFTTGDTIISLERVRRVDRYPEERSITIWYIDGTSEDLHFSDRKPLDAAFKSIATRLETE